MNKTTSHDRVPATRDPFQHLFQRLFGDSLADFYEGDQGLTARANISESDDTYELAFELPGLDEKDIDVQLHDRVLTIRAERKDDREQTGKRWHRVEHRYGSYSRAIALPQDCDGSGIEAVYRQGVLTVTVPKQPAATPAKISVRS
jgi:HSP20 family protein